MTLDWEMIGGITALVVVVFGTLHWVIATYAEYRVRETTEKMDIQEVTHRLNLIENDLKEVANTNIQLSNSFHAEINKILHKLSED